MHRAIVKSPVVGDVTRTVGTLTGAMNNVVMTASVTIAGLAPTVPANNVDPPRPDRNCRPYLADVQCAARKRVGHVAKHCDMLATVICLERYMEHDLTTSTWDSVEKDWLKRWNKRLGNPDRTPCQVMRTYVEDLNITIAHLDDEMVWDC